MMAIKDLVPLVLKDVTLTIETDDYKKAVSSVTFTPSASTITWTGLGGNTYSDTSTATWTCGLEFAQDWDTEDSLSAYLYTNEGTTKAVTFVPKAGGPSFTADVVITPGAIGGAVNAYATASVTLGVNGKPELVPVG